MLHLLSTFSAATSEKQNTFEHLSRYFKQYKSRFLPPLVATFCQLKIVYQFRKLFCRPCVIGTIFQHFMPLMSIGLARPIIQHIQMSTKFRVKFEQKCPVCFNNVPSRRCQIKTHFAQLFVKNTIINRLLHFCCTFCNCVFTRLHLINGHYLLTVRKISIF